MASSKQRKAAVIEAFRAFGGTATTRQIAEKLKLNVNGVSQTIGSIKDAIVLSGKGGDTKWRLEPAPITKYRRDQLPLD